MTANPSSSDMDYSDFEILLYTDDEIFEKLNEPRKYNTDNDNDNDKK
jgi:hypothetical protein